MVEPIRGRIGETLEYRSSRRKIVKALETISLATSRYRKAQADIAKLEQDVSASMDEVASARAELEHYSGLRDLYRGGWIDPKSSALDAIASRMAIWQERLFGTVGYDSTTLGLLFAANSALEPACANPFSRSINAIVRSGMASGEEKARVLASLVLASGGSAHLAHDGSFLYALAKKSATQDDIREIDRKLRALAAAHEVKVERVHGRLFGKDYYIYCDPACQPSPGLGAPPRDGFARLLRLDKVDY